ncbi:MAG TPA: hypothetical protein VKV20_19025 [Ktedonobacteraceae bacterium]|jgi:hypothetical protein|nr:hypothetical protein [Ktedonobacteraceae bacterium]
MDKLSFDPSPDPSWQQEHLPPDLQAIASAYVHQPVPHPSSSASRRLMQRLLTETTYANQQGQPARLWQTLAMARWRMYLMGSWFWIASVLLLLAGILLARSLTVSDLIILLILLLPLTTVLGLAHALRTPSAGLRAVEASCPVNFVQTSIGLGLALLAFDSLLGLIATLGFTLANWAPFWNLLLAWLAPLLLLTAISLPIALLRNVRLAALIGGLPWLLLGLLALAEQHRPGVAELFFSLPQDTLSFASHLAAIALSLLLLAALTAFAPRWQRFCTW